MQGSNSDDSMILAQHSTAPPARSAHSGSRRCSTERRTESAYPEAPAKDRRRPAGLESTGFEWRRAPNELTTVLATAQLIGAIIARQT